MNAFQIQISALFLASLLVVGSAQMGRRFHELGYLGNASANRCYPSIGFNYKCFRTRVQKTVVAIKYMMEGNPGCSER